MTVVFTRIREVKTIEPVPFVYDLKVEGDESYMTGSMLAHNGGKRKGAMCAVPGKLASRYRGVPGTAQKYR